MKKYIALLNAEIDAVVMVNHIVRLEIFTHLMDYGIQAYLSDGSLVELFRGLTKTEAIDIFSEILEDSEIEGI